MQKKRAFTLIELLVVIAVITLLIAILVPALSKARDQAKRVACMSNCKQIGVAVQLYSMSHRERFPAVASHSENQNPKSYWLNLLDSTADTSLVYRCPKDPSEDFLDWKAVDWKAVEEDEQIRDDLYKHRWASYALNYLIVKEPHPYSEKLSRIRRPAQTVFIAEAQVSAEAFDHIHPEKFLMLPPKRQVAVERHLGKANYIFADSHVATLSIKETCEPDVKNLWDPFTAPDWGETMPPPPPPGGGCP